ncbi:MAG: SH3 domain-containing protein, partial [Burkholderiaceae bacterium]
GQRRFRYMFLKRAAIRLFSLVSLCLLLSPLPSQAREMVSIRGHIVNMRSGPSTGAQILWELERGYPLEVLQRKGNWLQVRDFENDKGWVARSLTGHTRYHIVKARVANIRSGPGTRYRVVGKSERYDLMRTRGAKTGWVKVQSSDGVTGWISRTLLWGW